MYNRKKQDLVDSMMLDLQLAMCDWFWPLSVKTGSWTSELVTV